MEETLLQAIQALYNGADPVAQQQANTWLQQFATQPAAWGAALGLLQPGSVSTEAVFFAANMLLNKTRTEWGKLSQQEREQLAQATRVKLAAILESSATPQVVSERCCLLACVLSVLSGPQEALTQAGAALQLAGGALQQAPLALAPLRSSLLMLQLLAEEAHALDRGRRQAVVPPLLSMTATSAGSGAGGVGGAAAGVNGQGADGQQQQGCLSAVVQLCARALAALAQQQQQGAGAAVETAQLAVLRCLRAWLVMDVSGGGSTSLSPGELRAQAPGLIPGVLALLGSPTAATSEALCQAVSDLLTDVLGPSGKSLGGDAGPGVQQGSDSGSTSSGRQPDLSALGEVVSGLMALQAALMAPDAVLPAQAAARVASCIMERDPGVFGGPSPGSAELASLALSLLGRPERRVAEAVLEYFLALNTLPLAERHPQLGAPLFGSALPALVRSHACHPAGLVRGWEDDPEEDEGAFYGFREELLADVLESVYGMLRLAYITAMADAIRTAATWQQAEAAVFGLHAVALPVKAHAVASNTSSTSNTTGSGVSSQGQLLAGNGTSVDGASKSNSSSGGSGGGEELNAALLAIFNDVCSPDGSGARLMAHPLAARGVVRLIGGYAAWFGKTPSAPLLNALQVLLAALRLPEAQMPAALSFRNLCVRCGATLSEPGVLGPLMQAVLAVVAPQPSEGTPAVSVGIGLEERRAVVEGLARLVGGGMAADAAAGAGAALVAPMIARSQSLAHAGGLSGPQLTILAEELQLMASTVRFLEFPGEASRGADHPALRVLQAAWPVLAGVAGEPACCASAPVAEALCEVYKRSLLCAKLAALPLLPVLLSSVMHVFTSHAHACCLEVLGTVAELFGEVVSNAEARVLQQQALAAATARLLTLAVANTAEPGTSAPSATSPSTSSAPSSTATAATTSSNAPAPVAAAAALAASLPGELLAAYLTLADRYVIFARSSLLASPVLPDVLRLALAGLAAREREPCASALALLAHLVGCADKLTEGDDETAESKARLVAVVSASANDLIAGLVCAGLDTCPRQLMRALAGCLHALLTSNAFGQGAAALLAAALTAPEIVGRRPDLLSAEDCGRFAALALRQPLLPRGRFDALVSDFFSIARGEAGTDVLMAYEM